MDYLIILLGSGCLVCLTPLAIYLLYLSHLNGRTPPTLVPGSWDFGAVILGLSGFLVLAGPVLLTLVDSVWRGYMFAGWENLRSAGRREAVAGSFMAVGYLILLSVGLFALIRRRRPITAIYNVAASSVEATVIEVLDQLGYSWRRADGRVEIGLRKADDPAAPPAGRFFPHELAAVQVDAFPATGHATLRWSGAYEGIRREVESTLPAALSVHGTVKNPAAGWMFTAAVTILIVMLLWLAVLIFLMVTPPPK